MDLIYKISVDETLKIEHIKKKNIRRVYFKIISSNHIQITTNFSHSKSDVELIISKNRDLFIKKLNKFRQISNIKKYYYLFGEKLENGFFETKQIKNIQQFYHFEIKKVVEELVLKHSKNMNLKFEKISLKAQKSIWGSCSGKNHLSFNINLAQLPLEIIEYIVIHELAHIKHKNHSKEFWTFVSEFSSDYKTLRKALRVLEKNILFIL